MIILIILGFIALLLFFTSRAKKNLIKNSLDAVTIIQVKFWQDLSYKLSHKYPDKDVKIMAGAISNIIFSKEHVSKEQAIFVEKNTNIINLEIKNLKNDEELCEILRRSVMVEMIMKYIQPGEEFVIFKYENSSFGLRALLHTSLKPFIKYNILNEKDLYKDINMILFIEDSKRYSKISTPYFR